MDPTQLSTPTLESELVGLAGHLAAAQARFLRLLAEYDSRDGWAGPGLRSCAHWLSWRIGMDLRTAREQLRVAHALTDLPQLAGAFAAGRVSYSKVRAITRIAAADTEDEWLELALAGTASHIEHLVALTRTGSTDPTQTAARRYLRYEWAEDGSLLLRARLPADQGAALLAALDAAAEQLDGSAEHPGGEPDGAAPAEAGPDPWTEPAPGPDWSRRQDERTRAGTEHAPGPALDRAAARRADALIALTETGTGTARPEVLVHLRCDAADTADTGTAAWFDGGPAVAASTAARISCTASVQALLTDRRGNPLFLGRRRRLVSRAQRRALAARDGGRCRFPGCATRRVDAHHIVSWLAGGPTDIDNLCLLCRFHHGLVHDRGYRIGWVGGDLEFHRPDGTPVPAFGPATSGSLDHLVENHTVRSPGIDGSSLTPTWGGEHLDPDAVLHRLLPETRPTREEAAAA